MRLATITNWAYGTTVALTLASAITMLLASGAQDAERAAVAQRYTLDQASTSVAEDVSALSDQAQGYVVSGNADHLAEYRKEAAQLRSVEDRLHRLKDVGAQASRLFDKRSNKSPHAGSHRNAAMSVRRTTYSERSWAAIC